MNASRAWAVRTSRRILAITSSLSAGMFGSANACIKNAPNASAGAGRSTRSTIWPSVTVSCISVLRFLVHGVQPFLEPDRRIVFAGQADADERDEPERDGPAQCRGSPLPS